MKTQHTPGPWHDCGGAICKVYVNKPEDCEMVPITYGPYEQADARLIAAAPDLLEALEMVMEKYSKNLDGFAFEQVFQAIKKAKGE